MQDEKKNNIKKIIFWLIGISFVVVLLTIFINNIFYQHEEALVYVTETGECYHSKGCFYLRSIIPIGLSTAKAKGYRACSYCHGYSSENIIVNDYVSSFFLSIAILILLSFAIIFIIAKYKEYKENKKIEVVCKPITASNYIENNDNQEDYNVEESELIVGDEDYYAINDKEVFFFVLSKLGRLIVNDKKYENLTKYNFSKSDLEYIFKKCFYPEYGIPFIMSTYLLSPIDYIYESEKYINKTTFKLYEVRNLMKAALIENLVLDDDFIKNNIYNHLRDTEYLKDITLSELKEFCRDNGIEGCSMKNKSEIIEIIKKWSYK